MTAHPCPSLNCGRVVLYSPSRCEVCLYADLGHLVAMKFRVVDAVAATVRRWALEDPASLRDYIEDNLFDKSTTYEDVKLEYRQRVLGKEDGW